MHSHSLPIWRIKRRSKTRRRERPKEQDSLDTTLLKYKPPPQKDTWSHYKGVFREAYPPKWLQRTVTTVDMLPNGHTLIDGGNTLLDVTLVIYNFNGECNTSNMMTTKRKRKRKKVITLTGCQVGTSNEKFYIPVSPCLIMTLIFVLRHWKPFQECPLMWRSLIPSVTEMPPLSAEILRHEE